MWRYGAMALVALTFSNENILFLEKYQHIHHDRINYIDPGPCHGLVIKQKNGNQKQAFVSTYFCLWLRQDWLCPSSPTTG